MGATTITTYASSPRQPGSVTQATWRGGRDGTQVAFVTIVGGEHRWPEPDGQTGYDSADGMWAFFSQFLTRTEPAPRIVSVPVSNTQIAGQSASFWVSATGWPPLHYQWQKNGADIPGATSNWLTVATVSTGDDGATFCAVVSNDVGSATSSAATLTVRPAPTDPIITLQPADQLVPAGQPVRFTVVARGNGPLQYQWRKNGMNLPGANAAGFALAAAITPDSGATFSVSVSSAVGSVTSVPATLTVTPATGAPNILQHPERVRLNVGETGTFSVTATSPTPMTYQWQQGALTTNMVDIPGATGASYSTPRAVLGNHRTLFRCVVSNAAGNATSACELLLITAIAKPTIP
jgi:hypothetical protein